MNTMDNRNNKYLTFRLGVELFAVEILQVREVLDYVAPIRVPRSPEHLVGVINLRGNVVPVVDLRGVLDIKQTAANNNACIIIVEIEIQDETVLVGALADSAHEVVTIETSAVDPTPKIGIKIKTEFLRGIGKINSKFVIILNLTKLLNMNDMKLLDRMRSPDDICNGMAGGDKPALFT